MDYNDIFANQIIPSLVAGFQSTANYAVDYFQNVVPIGLKIFAMVWIVTKAINWFRELTGENELEFEVHTYSSDGRIRDVDFDYEIDDSW